MPVDSCDVVECYCCDKPLHLERSSLQKPPARMNSQGSLDCEKCRELRRSGESTLVDEQQLSGNLLTTRGVVELNGESTLVDEQQLSLKYLGTPVIDELKEESTFGDEQKLNLNSLDMRVINLADELAEFKKGDTGEFGDLKRTVQSLEIQIKEKDKAIENLTHQLSYVDQYHRDKSFKVGNIEEHEENIEHISLKVAERLNIQLDERDVGVSHRFVPKNYRGRRRAGIIFQLVMAADDSMSDDVFESAEDTAAAAVAAGGGGGDSGQVKGGAEGLRVEQLQQMKTPSPTGYRDYKPPADLIRHYEQQQEDAEQTVHKTILLGDSGVGKTSLLVQFDTGKFQTGNFSATVGIGFTNKMVTVDQTRVKLQIWDTAGQERFRSVTHAYYRDAHALLLLYDVTSKTSFDNIRAWLGEIREYAQDDVVIMLLGNKSDSGSERLVRREDGERLASEYNVTFMETSAKTGLNVELAFMAVARELKSKQLGHKDETIFNVQEYVREQTQTATCPPCNT